MTRTALMLISHIFAFVIGGACGATVFVMRSTPLLALCEPSSAGDDAYVTYRFGSYPAARQAILKYIALAEHRQGALYDDADQSVDVMLSYGRLAIAAEKAGDLAESKSFMQRAMQVKRRDSRSMTETSIRQFIERVDAGWDRRMGR